MLDSQILGVIALVRAALTGELQQLPVDFDLENAYDSIIKHNIVVMALEGAALCGIPKDHPTMKKLFSHAFKAIIHVERQDQAAKELFSAFENAGIDFLPVKGALIRSMYPKPAYRSMGDMDILIRLAQREKIEQVMLDLGYYGGKETDHELIWRRDGIMFELHKHLIPSYNEDYYAYYGDGWKFARPTDTSRYGMSDEDHFVYVFAHFAKHYRDGGVGIRQMCDLWIFRNAHPDMNEDYIRAELKKLEMDAFYGYILQTLDAWFTDAGENERTRLISQVVFNSGCYGNEEGRMLALGMRIQNNKQATGRVRYKHLLQHIFLPKKEMVEKYPILEEKLYLLPVIWIYRIFCIAYKEPFKIRRQCNRFRTLKRGNLDSYQTALTFVGLKYDKMNKC